MGHRLADLLAERATLLADGATGTNLMARGLAYEQGIDAHYLQRLVSAYTRFFYDYDASPLVIINAESIDLANNDEDYRLLFESLREVGKGRHYLNPLPL